MGGLVLLFFSSMAFRVLEDAIAIIFHRPLPTLKRKFWVSALIPYLFILIVAVIVRIVVVFKCHFVSSIYLVHEFFNFFGDFRTLCIDIFSCDISSPQVWTCFFHSIR